MRCSIIYGTALHTAPTGFGGITSIWLSSGSRHHHFFKTYSNKTGRNKHAYSVVSLVQNCTGLGLNCVHQHYIGQTVMWLAFKMLKNCTNLRCNYSSSTNKRVFLIDPPYRGGIHLDEGRIDGCAQSVITQLTFTILNHLKNNSCYCIIFIYYLCYYVFKLLILYYIILCYIILYYIILYYIILYYIILYYIILYYIILYYIILYIISYHIISYHIILHHIISHHILY